MTSQQHLPASTHASSPPDAATSLLDGLPFVVVRVSATGQVQGVSGGWRGLIGDASLPAVGSSWEAHLDPADHEAWRELSREVLSGRRQLGVVYMRLRRADGSLRHVEARCARRSIPGSASDGLGILLCDAAGREQTPTAARRALRLPDDATRALVERAAFGIFRCTPDGRLVDANPAIAAMLGHGASESLLGRNLFAELRSGAEVCERCVEELSRGVPEVLCDLRGTQPNGTAVHLRLAVTGEFEGTTLRFLQGVAENITERARREEIVRRGERMASLTRTLAGVAHEINNPLAAITGFAQILLKREQPDDERHAHETILHEARRAARIIKDLLTIARRQEGSERVRVDVNGIVRYLVGTQRYAMDTRGIAIDLNLASDAPAILADPAQIEQVILNLVVNARQALETRIESRHATPGGDDGRWVPSLRVTTARRHGRFVLTVTDNGPGIPPLDLPHIWDPFWTTREEGEGSGLGLSVVQGIVGAHGGTIEAASAPGVATTFTVTLPAVAQPAPPPVPRAPRDTRGEGRHQPLDILVVDDELVIRELLTRYFTSRGHAVVAAADAEQALRLAEHNSFDAIITDLRMPGMDGRTLIRRLRLLPSCQNTRFILSTGDETAIPAQSGSDEPAVDVVPKPYDVDALVSLVEGR